MFLLASLLTMTVDAGEFGAVFGGSKRVVKQPPNLLTPLARPAFELSNSAFDVYYAVELDPTAVLKIQAGRIEGPVSFEDKETVAGIEISHIFDLTGEVQHIEALVEYRFDEPLGSTGLFAGVGAYRMVATGHSSSTNYGFPVGLTADFPITPRYGVIAAATYHFTKADLQPRYLTIGAGLRVRY